jgi:integrase
MSIRKRTWKTPSGEDRAAWVLDFFDGSGKRRHETFTRRKDAEQREAQVRLDVTRGATIPLRDKTIGQIAGSWLDHLREERREQSTINNYEQHLRLHILPVMGRQKIGKLGEEVIAAFRKHLQARVDGNDEKMTRTLARSVWVSFKSLLRHARLAHLAQNVKGFSRDARARRKLEVGKDVPSPAEIKRLYEATAGDRPRQKRKRALLLVAAFCGLRASELRGLRWEDIKTDELQVDQRADRFGKIGNPKSASSRRIVPLSPDVTRSLREWRIAQGGGTLVFATKRGTIETHTNMLRSLALVMRDAGVVDEDGVAKYTLHDFRHFFASWCISPKERGGRGLSPKVVQEWLGHSTIAMTLDRYGHLFKEVDQSELAASTKSVLS